MSAFFVSLVFVIIVVCSVLSTTYAQTQTQFEEFLLTLERNETEAAASSTRHHQTPTNAVTAVQSTGDAGVTRSDSPDGDSVSTSPSTKDEEADEDEADALDGQTSNDLLSYFKDVPRTHWSCCMLGLLAGNKGFQCRAEFYSSSMTLRNFNRPGRHLGHGGPNSGPRDRTRGYEIMRTFRRCVTNNAHEFHRCCHVAVTERQELSVARSYRRNRSSSR